MDETTAPPHPSFVGRGFGWPLAVDHTGSIALTSGADDVERSLRIVLATAPGERVMRPRFGCRIWDMVFEPVTESLLGGIAEAVRDAVAQWEPRVDVTGVDVTADPDDAALVLIVVRYAIKATNDERNLVYPFYVIPRGAER